MQKNTNKILAVFLAVLILLTSVPFAVSAVGETSGKCGDNVYWTLDENGTLTISGEGEMKNYSGNNFPPYNTAYIKNVIILYGVSSIGDEAFNYCTSLTSIEIPNSVTSIGDWAFSDCRSLTSIEIPNSVTSIGYDAFEYCDSLTSIVIPNSVTSIGYGAFSYCTRLTSIEIPNSVTSIGDFAFYDCRSLTSIVIPNGVTSIGNGAFSYCRSLTSVEIPNSVTSIGNGAFHDCSRLTSIVIPNSVTTIGDYAFSHCSSLTSIVIPNGVTSIGDNAFSDCRSLTSIEIPNSVTSIGDNAFSDCICLTSINVAEDNLNYSSADGVLFNKDKTQLIQYPCGNERTEYTIPNSVTSIGDNAFCGCSLTSVEIPNSVTSIGDWAFKDCHLLESIEIPNSVKTIGREAFSECLFLACVTIPESIEYIEADTFSISPFTEDIYIKGKNTVIDDSNFGITNGQIFIEGFKEKYIDFYKTMLSINRSVLKGELSEDEAVEIWTKKEEELSRLAEDYNVEVEEGTANPYAIIHCYKNSKAAEYAISHGITVAYFEDGEPHKHSFVAEITIPATDTEDGIMTYTCSCGNKFIKTLRATGNHTHSYTSEITTEPTCTTEGVITYTCECGDSYTDTVEKLDHETEHVEIPSTCTVKGVSYDVCLNCSETFNYTVLDLAEHTEETISGKAATCTETGLTDGVKCSVCGEILKAQETIEKLDHTYGEWQLVKEPTCAETGIKEKNCTVCGDIVAETVPVTDNHTYVSEVTKEPTYFSEGEMTKTCSICGKKINEVIAKLTPKNNVKDDYTGVSVSYENSAFNGKIEISVAQVFDGSSFNLLNLEKGNFKNELFDIVLTKDNEKIQPNSVVLVSIPLPNGYNPETTNIYHITNDGKLEKLNSRYENGCIIFETTHFSYYAIVDESAEIQNPSDTCTHICHKTGFMGFIYKIVRIFWKLFGTNKTCACGANHY